MVSCHAPIDPPCVACAQAGASLCVIHLAAAVRQVDDVPITCYACGRLIRRSARWQLAGAGEGALHSRPICVTTSPDRYVIPILNRRRADRTPPKAAPTSARHVAMLAADVELFRLSRKGN